ncbi:MAG: helix-turn-helix transcriptional regulator [Erysipelotrichaceae bacterium]|nr:helix-turn-helix transcriptional regulator [Erysipelotrichaceae bacterium]
MKHTDDNTLYDVAELFKNFSDSTRIRILYCLIENERSVTEICDLLNMNQSAISHQLRILKNSKLIKNRREGKTVYYSLADDHVYNIISQGIEHVEE